jgi:hypothetical protein
MGCVSHLAQRGIVQLFASVPLTSAKSRPPSSRAGTFSSARSDQKVPKNAVDSKLFVIVCAGPNAPHDSAGF